MHGAAKKRENGKYFEFRDYELNAYIDQLNPKMKIQEGDDDKVKDKSLEINDPGDIYSLKDTNALNRYEK